MCVYGCFCVLLLLQDAVSLCDATGNEFARGLSNFDSKVRVVVRGRQQLRRTALQRKTETTPWSIADAFD